MKSITLPRVLRRFACLAALVCPAALLAAPGAGAAVTTFGSPLSVPATLDTAENLNYEGTNVPVPGSVFHINHDGADTLLWSVAQPQGAPAAPAGGQITSVALEGCARQPQGAPAPLTQIHFQDLVPTPDGGARIVVTTGAFDIPVCGAAGASASTVTSYAPVNFCVNQGDYVGFNDEGGFVGGEGLPPYPAGVPYQVIGAVSGATMDSFVRNGGTNNGATISPSDRTNHDGFASNRNEELMLQATLATGVDATPLCPGGTKGVPAATSGYSAPPPAPALQAKAQTDGINHRGIASIALYCHAAAGCRGTLTLTALTGHGRGRQVRVSFALAGGKTGQVPVHLPGQFVTLARRHRKGVPVRLDVALAGLKLSQTITLRIF